MTNDVCILAKLFSWHVQQHECNQGDLWDPTGPDHKKAPKTVSIMTEMRSAGKITI